MPSCGFYLGGPMLVRMPDIAIFIFYCPSDDENRHNDHYFFHKSPPFPL